MKYALTLFILLTVYSCRKDDFINTYSGKYRCSNFTSGLEFDSLGHAIIVQNKFEGYDTITISNSTTANQIVFSYSDGYTEEMRMLGNGAFESVDRPGFLSGKFSDANNFTMTGIGGVHNSSTGVVYGKRFF